MNHMHNARPARAVAAFPLAAFLVVSFAALAASCGGQKVRDPNAPAPIPGAFPGKVPRADLSLEGRWSYDCALQPAKAWLEFTGPEFQYLIASESTSRKHWKIAGDRLVLEEIAGIENVGFVMRIDPDGGILLFLDVRQGGGTEVLKSFSTGEYSTQTDLGRSFNFALNRKIDELFAQKPYIKLVRVTAGQ